MTNETTIAPNLSFKKKRSRKKRKYYPHNFPAIFFLTGAIFGLIENWWVKTIMFLLLMFEVYWFNYELEGAIKNGK